MKTKIYPFTHTSFVTIFFIACFFSVSFLQAQTTKKLPVKRTQPIWWIGESIAGNLNFYQGTTQRLNESVYVPTAFHNGQGLRLYFSFLAEYRPNKVIGGMLNVAFNNRSSSFDGVITPNNEKAFLYTVLRYVNIEPSLRIAPFSSAFYLFAGPTLSINSTHEFFYEQEGQHEIRGNWSELRKYVFGAQAGAGIDIPISKKTSANQLTISPFASFQTNLFDDPRRNESWNIYSFRGGLAVKFGTRKPILPKKKSETEMNNESALVRLNPTRPAIVHDTIRIVTRDVRFSAQISFIENPDLVKEIFPLRNSVFFNAGSTVIPERYIQLTPSEATAFRENQLQDKRPANWYNTRSDRQLAVYHHILNILGDRMRSNPQSTIVLSAGKSGKSGDGPVLVSNIKSYLVTFFGIDAARIAASNTGAQFIASIQSGETKDPELRRQDDRRVDIASNYPELLAPFGGKVADFAVPDQSVTFTADGAQDQLQSWSINVINNGVSRYYGPYTQDKIVLSARNILNEKKQGDYVIQMTGLTKDSQIVRKETTLNITPPAGTVNGLRYSVLFDFDRSKTQTANRKFLEEIVAPQITDSSTVIIHGHTDVIGDGNYNKTLSANRVQEARQILEELLTTKGRKGVKFEYYGFGKDQVMSPFGNKLPEERFYNRTVIIDIIKGK